MFELCVKTDNDHSNSPAVTHSNATSVSKVGKKDAAELVNLIQSYNDEFLCQVKTIKCHVTVPKQTTITGTCQANMFLFEPNERPEWPTGLIVCEMLTTVKEEKPPS